jgi:hypothetical protein
MSRLTRPSLLRLVGRIRTARQALERAEAEVEALLGEGLVEEMAEGAPDATRHLREAVGVFLDRAPPSEQTAPVAGALREAVLAVATRSLERSIASRKRPSTAARVLAVLLEEPGREFNAASVARRAGCTEAVARTTLNRLVAQGHGRRSKDGSFRAERPTRRRGGTR